MRSGSWVAKDVDDWGVQYLKRLYDIFKKASRDRLHDWLRMKFAGQGTYIKGAQDRVATNRYLKEFSHTLPRG